MIFWNYRETPESETGKKSECWKQKRLRVGDASQENCEHLSTQTKQ